jgi:hypothetical protein
MIFQFANAVTPERDGASKPISRQKKAQKTNINSGN